MERIISDEEKIRRAIEISQRRNNDYYRAEATRVTVNNKKNYKLFKRMILQIIICLLIYTIFYLISSTNYVFSESIIKSTNEILSYDINFQKVYDNVMLFVDSNTNLNQVTKENNSVFDNNNVNNENVIGNNSIENNVLTNTIKEESSNEDNTNEENKEKNEEKTEEKDEDENKEKKEVSKAKTQMELDAEKVKEITKFTKPLSGTITSEFGEREVIAEGMTSDHKGIDIATNSGTNIKAAMAGTVSVAEENGEYGKFIKITNGDVMTVYAHCQKLKVKVGDKIKIRTNNSNCRVNWSFDWTSFTF